MSSSILLDQRRLYPSVGVDDYVLSAPNGCFLKIPKELYDALVMFVGQQDQVNKGGQVIVNCNRGNVAGVEITLKLK